MSNVAAIHFRLLEQRLCLTALLDFNCFSWINCVFLETKYKSDFSEFLIIAGKDVIKSSSTHKTKSTGYISNSKIGWILHRKGPEKPNVPADTSAGSSVGFQSVEMKAKFSAGTRGNKFSPDVEKVKKLQWQAGKNISKMNPEHDNWSLLSCPWEPGALWTGAGGWTRGGGGRRAAFHAGGDKVGPIIRYQLKRRQGSWTSFFSQKCFPPRGTGCCGTIIKL